MENIRSILRPAGSSTNVFDTRHSTVVTRLIVRVFISYSHKDKKAVHQLAEGLRTYGIEPWFDEWEVGPGDSFIEKMNEGLDESEGGVVVFSKETEKSGWRDEESNYLTYARKEEGKVLIPVIVGDDVKLPPLLRPIVRRRITEVEAIADGLRERKKEPGTPLQQQEAKPKRVLITLLREPDQPEGDPGFTTTVQVDGIEYASERIPGLSQSLVSRINQFMQGPRAGIRSPDVADRRALEANLAELGRELAKVCLPGESGQVLAELVSGSPVGTTVEVCFEANHPVLLGLPFEALRLPGDVLLSVEANVIMLRRPTGIKPTDFSPLAGPLKILAAVGAPDEEHTSSTVLDIERELGNILNALEDARRDDNAAVRILEVGNPEVIGAAIERDVYHVLHISCHGMPGKLELEDEEGRAVQVTAKELLKPIKEAQRQLPMVFLNTCHGGVAEAQTASLAQELLKEGIPCVLAMQTSVSDRYATQLAKEFYRHLQKRETNFASHALAAARKDVENERQKAIKRPGGATLQETQPEYATATLYVAGEEPRLADFGLDKVPLRDRPVYQVSGPVPHLGIDDLIGRRKTRRNALRVLRDTKGTKAGVALTGIGGIGKSAVAGRIMQRLAEDKWMLAVVQGRLDLGKLAISVALASLQTDNDRLKELAQVLMQENLDDRLKLQAISMALAEHLILLVLDDFEQNLTLGGAAFRDQAAVEYLRQLAQNCRRGRLLITCRYPVPGMEAYLEHIQLGRLSDAEIRKLLLRLPALEDRETKELTEIFQRIGGHPRMLEFLDGLLHGGHGRLPHVTEKLNKVLEESGARGKAEDFSDALQQTLLLGAQDVFLDELLDMVQQEDLAEALYQTAVSNLPVSPTSLAHMLADAPADSVPADQALSRLAHLSLVYRFPDGDAWVHRWTAEALAKHDTEAHKTRCNRAGRYRMWHVQHEGGGWPAIYEAIRNHLSAEDFDTASGLAQEALQILSGQRQTVQASALASEVLDSLPLEHENYFLIADAEAKSHLALGFIKLAFDRYTLVQQKYERLIEAEPDRADYQRDLSVSYERMGDLYRALGQGEKARESYQESLAIRERLAQSEPDRADYQRDLSVSYNKMGDLYRALGQGEKARESYQESLAIRERLAQSEPDRADYQRDLSVSYNKMGDLYRALGQGEKARESYQESLSIAERLAQSEPDRADYQRDLSVSYNKMGDLYRALGQGEKARESYQESLSIAERLAQSEPDRADYQRDLSVSYNKMGDLYRALGQGEKARESYQESLAIRERLAQSEPDRADYQRDLSVSYNKMGDLYRALGQGEKARESYQESLSIAERLAQSEPDRADYQRDLSVSYNKMGDLYRALGEGEKARASYQESLSIAERLADSEPDRADYQRDLSVSYERIGDSFLDGGDGEGWAHSYQNALEIRERLWRSEPARADYQREFAVTLFRTGVVMGAEGLDVLKQAQELILSLYNEGRLSKSDYGLIEAMEQAIDAAGSE